MGKKFRFLKPSAVSLKFKAKNCNDTDSATGQKLSEDSFRSGILLAIDLSFSSIASSKCCNSLQPFSSTHGHDYDYDSTVKLDRTQLLLKNTETLTEISIRF